jgi:hypothetical protein
MLAKESGRVPAIRVFETPVEEMPDDSASAQGSLRRITRTA